MSGEPPVAGVPIDLTAGDGTAVLWGLATDDLNVNLVAWGPDGGVDTHVNVTRDVLVVVVAGTVAVTVDASTAIVGAGECIVIPKGATRSIRATGGDARYLTVHRRNPPMSVGRSAERTRLDTESPA